MSETDPHLRRNRARGQSRDGRGRFRRNTLENCFGLRAAICTCGAINPYTQTNIGTEHSPFLKWIRPEHCERCGEAITGAGEK